MVVDVPVQNITVDDIKFDDTNPNILTPEQMIALKSTMEKYGFLAPVILNKNLEVIDGEHRVTVYKELKKETIPAYVLDIDTIDKKILRQLMNKLRGEHDPFKDKEEFKMIHEAGRLNDFTNLLAVNITDFDKVINPPINNYDEDRESEATHKTAENYLTGTIKQMILYFSNEDYEKFIPKFNKYMEQLNIDNHTDMFMEFYKEYERNHP
tara:strand:+ start:156 stop:785 length:630 start_codon:yes stop_codon:yes gene_type:complete